MTPAGYSTWTAAAKAEWLWNEAIMPTAYPTAGLPALRMPFMDRPLAEVAVIVVPRQLRQALDRTDDFMEEDRPKVIHALGSVAMVELETYPDSRFTGLLAPPPHGGAVGLIRVSLVSKVGPKASFTPGVGLKFLLDGQPSADVLAMNHTVGQGRDHNLFSHSITNDLSETHLRLRTPQKVMAKLFGRVSRQPRRLASFHLADRHRDGTAVHSPVVPRRLVLSPTAEAKAIFSGRADVDFRVALAAARESIDLYTVDGVDDEGLSPIGTLRTTTGFVASDAGDRLFFRHVQDPADARP